MEQKKANKNVLRLVEEQLREKEEALIDILKLEREMDEKQKLEMEIQELKGKLQVMKHLGNEDDEALQSKMKELEEELAEKEDQRNDVESLNQTLLIKLQALFMVPWNYLELVKGSSVSIWSRKSTEMSHQSKA